MFIVIIPITDYVVVERALKNFIADFAANLIYFFCNIVLEPSNYRTQRRGGVSPPAIIVLWRNR